MSSVPIITPLPVPGPEPVVILPRPGEDEPKQVNILELVHRNLRGRYVLTIALALACGLGGAAAGYLLPTPRFRSDGLIRVQPTMPTILGKNDTSIQPMFTSFVSTQANLLQNSRVLTRAMNSEAWRKLGRPGAAQYAESFRQQLTVRTPRDSPELIFVSFSDQEAAASLVAVQEVITAYQELFGGSESKEVRDMQVNALTSRKQTLDTQRRDLETRIQTIASEFETDDLARLSEHYLTQLLTLDGRVAELSLKMAEAGIDPNATIAETPPDAPAPGGASDAGTGARRTPEQIATLDPVMAKYLLDREAMNREIARLTGSGLSEQHRSVRNVTKQLEALEKTILGYADTWAEPAGVDAEGAVGPESLSPRQLVVRYQRLRQQAEAWRAKTEQISKARMQIDSLRREVKNVQELLDEVARRMDQIAMESTVEERIGRIEVILPEAAPTTPTDDPRKKFAAMGLLAGGGLPVVLMFLLGVADRRFRYADQAVGTLDSVRMLGMLPELPNTPDDPEQVAAAVHSVHHVRTRLQIADGSRRVYAITSPTSGDGKTSLSLSLAMSFASSGTSTLLVDFDLVGHALTTRMGPTPESGIGQYLISPTPGDPVVQTAIANLSIIRAGRGDVRCVPRIAGSAFNALIESMRPRFGVIVIDTGPILGSLEANMACTAADGVILVVGRGQHASRVREAYDHLRQLGARVAGMVFNRANNADFARSTAVSASFRSVRATGLPAIDKAPPGPASRSSGFDTLSRSMVFEIEQNAEDHTKNNGAAP